MHNHKLKPESPNRKGSPFICHKMPFVCSYNPSDKPFICKNIPSIGFGRFGFTLVELIVTITIVGILAALAGPALTALIANQRLSSQANELLSDLTFARSEAVKRSSGSIAASGVTICKTANPNAATPDCNDTAADAWTSGRIVFIDNNADGVRDAADQVLRIRQELEGPTPGANRLLGDGDATGTANKITFLGTGATKLALGNEYQLTLCDKRGDNFGLAVAIHPLGRARVVTRGKNADGTAMTVCP